MREVNSEHGRSIAFFFFPTLKTGAFFTDSFGLVIQNMKTKHHLGKVSVAYWTLQERSKGISSLTHKIEENCT